MSERRELQGLTVRTKAGFEAVCPKGGFMRGNGRTLEVPFRYREQPPLAVVVPLDADRKQIAAAMLARAEAVDVALAEQAAEASARLDATFADLKQAFADLAARKTTKAEVKAKLAQGLGGSAAVAVAEPIEGVK